MSSQTILQYADVVPPSSSVFFSGGGRSLHPMLRIRIGSGFNQVTGSGDPDPGGQKSADCSLSEGFSCTLNVLYGGLGIRKPQFLIASKSSNTINFKEQFNYLSVKLLESKMLASSTFKLSCVNFILETVLHRENYQCCLFDPWIRDLLI
jgi:hypothetical protein